MPGFPVLRGVLLTHGRQAGDPAPGHSAAGETAGPAVPDPSDAFRKNSGSPREYFARWRTGLSTAVRIPDRSSRWNFIFFQPVLDLLFGFLRDIARTDKNYIADHNFGDSGKITLQILVNGCGDLPVSLVVPDFGHRDVGLGVFPGHVDDER